eukprot:6397175-Amphidinium_carterae.1
MSAQTVSCELQDKLLASCVHGAARACVQRQLCAKLALFNILGRRSTSKNLVYKFCQLLKGTVGASVEKTLS